MADWRTAGNDEGYFYVIALAREDIEACGYDASELDDEKMRYLAKKIADSIFDTGYWDILKEVLAWNDVPKLIDEDDLKRADEWYAQIDFDTMEEISEFDRNDFDSEDGYQEFVDMVDDWWAHLTSRQKVNKYREYNG